MFHFQGSNAFYIQGLKKILKAPHSRFKKVIKSSSVNGRKCSTMNVEKCSTLKVEKSLKSRLKKMVKKVSTIKKPLHIYKSFLK